MRTAAYARYSSDQQRQASIDDQLRNVRAWCKREGWPAPKVYADAAISGSRNDRPQYRAMLADAMAGEFGVLLVDDISRLVRDKDRCGLMIKRLVFAGVRVIGVSDGVDTDRKSHKADVGLRGLMAELYLDDLAEKTHRGQTGRALAGASPGGLPYGYRVAETGHRAIQADQADIVRRIFAEYIAGASPRDIAAGLNRDGVPSSRGRQWGMTAIHGDTRRGIGILANPIYVGRQVWNRSHFVKHPETGRRVRKERPQAEWIVSEHPELAIVTPEVWNAAQARLRARKQGGKGRGGGRPNRHLLSGLLRCSACGGPMVMVDRYRYGCARHKDRGASVCDNRLKVAKRAIEPALVDGIKRELLTPRAIEHAVRAAARQAKRAAPDLDAARATLAAAERTHANIMDAIRQGIVTPSTRAALIDAERELEQAKTALAAVRDYSPAQMLPRAREIWRRMVENLEHAADDTATRNALRDLIGNNVVVKHEKGEIFVELNDCQISLVAGARSVRYLTAPIRVPIPRKARRS